VEASVNIAFILFDGMTLLDFVGVYDPLTRLKTMNFMPDLAWDLVGWQESIRDSTGLIFRPDKIRPSLAKYDLVVVPGGKGSRELMGDPEFNAWLATAREANQVASVCTGSLLLASAGLLEGKQAATHPNARKELSELGVRVIEARLVEDGNILTSGGVTAAIDLGLSLCQQIAGSQAAELIRKQMDYRQPIPSRWVNAGNASPADRTGQVLRQTGETTVEVRVGLDGTGMHQIHTGIPFLDHMLTQIAVHGLFDITLSASGDLDVDPHHTVEDVALALGQAFGEALGDRAGIVRMASCEVPMDESLGRVTLDFSGRPYAVFEGAWHNPDVGGIPTSLIAHFFASFAIQARCNLHARIFYGRDDHHQAEALFKALGRALDASTQIDSRRTGVIPSSKGKL
jgi:imidazoleglycerol-phosphate dehydratase